MRYIQKRPEPQEFTNWKNESTKTPKTYDDLMGKNKEIVYESLINEQSGICAYCERQLVEVNGEKDYHIDHLNPQCNPNTDDLDYNNFLCSCLGNLVKGEPRHCGHLKANKILPVHPLQRDCQSKFTYNFTGEIDGIDQASKETIKILGLNIPKLVDMRNKVAEVFLTDDVNQEELQTFVASYITPDKESRRNPFCSMIEHLF